MGIEEIGPGLPTTAVSTAHSEHPSGGAHLARNHHGTRNSTLGLPHFFFGKKKLAKKFGAPKTAIKTPGGGGSGDSERAALRFGPGGSDLPHPKQLVSRGLFFFCNFDQKGR